jgi:sulfur relay (sulfurtransferase) DsrF/TusC family protein
MRRCLAVIERAYRGTLEEQYSHILWICLSLKKMGGQIGVLLRGNAVLYAQRDQQHLSLTISGLPVVLPDYEASINGLIDAGALVYVIRANVDQLGLTPGDLCPGVELIDAADLADLCATFDVIWYW